MKKSSKCLVLIGVVAITIGINGLFGPTNKINKNIGMQEAKAYNHNTANALDNVFIQDNNLVLPFIFDNKDQATTLDVRTEFARAGLTVRNIANGAVGTGTQITVNENTNVYNVLIYGDVTGDGLINLIDVQNIILHYLGQSTLTGLYAIAGNVSNNDNNINLIDAQRVILFYLGNLNAGLVVQEPEASKPEEPIEDTISRTIITPPTKTRYTVGQELDLTGGKINIVYASGKVESIDMQKSMVSGYDMNVAGTQVVTVRYKVNDTTTVRATFEIVVNVLDKDLENIIASIDGKDINMTKGVCYQSVEILLRSGESEKTIDINDLSFDISIMNNKSRESLGEENDIAIIEKSVLADGKIKVLFTAKVAGSYIITPKVGGVSAEIKIVVQEDESINKITLVSTANTMDFIQDETTKAEIKFYHIYPDDRTIEVKGPDISNVSLDDITQNVASISFLNEDEYLLPNIKSGNTVVEYASITPNQSGILQLAITIVNKDGTSHTENIEIEVKKVGLLINNVNTEIQDITLCDSEKAMEQAKINGQKIVRYENSIFEDSKPYYYTLIPIAKIDESGNKISSIVKVKDIYQLGFDTGKINFVDNVIYNITSDSELNKTMPSIDVKAFDENENMITLPDEAERYTTYANSEVCYIGIALDLNNMEKDFNSVIVYYENKDTVITTLTMIKSETNSEQQD